MANDRPETGTMQFGDDWPGVFIRGDNAFAFAMALRNALEDPTRINRDVIGTKMMLQGLADTLSSSVVGRTSKADLQALKPFDLCQPE